MITNPHTGEAVLRDGHGNETRIVFTEEAILAVEQALETGILELLERSVRGRLGLRDVQALVWAGMNAHRSRSGAARQVSAERAMKVIKACGGVVGVLPTLVEALTACKALGIDLDDEDDQTDGDGDGEMDPTSGGSAAS